MDSPLDPQRALVRAVRAGVLTSPAVGAAALAHSWGGGCVSALDVLLAVGFVWPAAVAVLARRRSVAALAVWLVAAQLGCHLLFSCLCSEVVSGQVSLATHVLAGVTAPMLLAHGLALVVTAPVLCRADAGLWAARTLVRAVRAAGSRLGSVAPLPIPACRRAIAAEQVVLPLVGMWKAPLPVRRGPPAALVAR